MSLKSDGADGTIPLLQENAAGFLFRSPSNIVLVIRGGMDEIWWDVTGFRLGWEMV